MTTWAQPIRHPWFNPPTMKRKLCHSDDDDDDASSPSDVPAATFSTGRRKRLRCNSLERTLAHMTLGGALATTSEDVDMWPKISPPRLHEQETLHVILPSSVEEPDTPASEPVDMEVEPTLVTTTPPPRGVHDWESIASGQLDIKEVEISSAVLECLRRQAKRPPAPIPLPSQTSQALVLYRAPGLPSLGQASDHQKGRPSQTSSLVAHEDDAMEVE